MQKCSSRSGRMVQSPDSSRLERDSTRTAVTRVQLATSRRGTSSRTRDLKGTDALYFRRRRTGRAAAAIARWLRMRSWTTRPATRHTAERGTPRSIASYSFVKSCRIENREVADVRRLVLASLILGSCAHPRGVEPGGPDTSDLAVY